MSLKDNRLQCVKYNGTKSNWNVINTGVPQGTKLGPLLFLILMNDACQDSIIPYFKYVDDLSMVESRSICKASKLQDELRKLQEWSNRNDMKLNASKCSVMQISFCKQPVQQTVLFIDDTQLCNVESPKILGLIVQSDLKWNKHVTDLLKRSNKKLYQETEIIHTTRCRSDHHI